MSTATGVPTATKSYAKGSLKLSEQKEEEIGLFNTTNSSSRSKPLTVPVQKSTIPG